MRINHRRIDIADQPITLASTGPVGWLLFAVLCAIIRMHFAGWF